MKLYADVPRRRTAQIVADLAMLAWVAGCVLLGRALHDAISALAAPGRRLESTGISFAHAMTEAGAAASDLPLVGDDLAGPFRSAASAGDGLSAVGTGLADGVNDLATIASWATAAIPILLVGLVWSLLRLRFARRATATQRLLGTDGDKDLLALRALSRQPLHRLTTISPDPVGAWRSGDEAAIAGLAALELRSSGLRPS
ncbi:MAG: hypothetical protein KBB39_00970 [Phycicoccus sp.]|nr:hypothetical protein [Phycicoccus sp.]